MPTQPELWAHDGSGVNEPDPVAPIERMANDLAATRMRLDAQKKAMADLLRNVGNPGVCTGPTCKADVFWVVHLNGRRTPYSLDGRNHFIDCPDRDQFRRK